MLKIEVFLELVDLCLAKTRAFKISSIRTISLSVLDKIPYEPFINAYTNTSRFNLMVRMLLKVFIQCRIAFF